VELKMTEKEIDQLCFYLDHILVSTGISEGFHSFDPVEVERLIKTIRNTDKEEK